MKKRIKAIIPLAVISAGCAIAATACGGNPYNFPSYSYQNPDRSEQPLETDAEITLDGKLDENVWNDENRKWLDVTKATDTNVNLRATSYIGEKGVYMAFDVDDPNVYCLNQRYTALNCAIELYVSAYADARDHAYEIDFTADGRCGVKICNMRGELVEWQARVASGVTTKGGAVNTSDCNGYVIEAFLPNYLFGESAPEFIYADIAVISTTDGEATGSRDWYPFAWREYGGVWMEPVTWFGFDNNGLTSGFEVSLQGEHATLVSKPMGIKNSNYSALIAAEEGYAITAVSCNGQDIGNRVTDTENGVRFDLSAVSEDLNFTVTTERITEGNKTLSGTVYLHKDAQKTPAQNVTLTLSRAGETVRTVTTDGQGAFSVENLEQGLYVLNAQKEGYGDLEETVLMNRDRNKVFLFEAEVFVKNSDWDLTDANDGVLIASGETPLQMQQSQDNFILSTKVSISREAEERLDRRNGDLRYELWAIYDAESGSLAGKYFSFDLYRTHNGDNVVWKIQIPNRNGNCVAGNWIDKYDLTEAQIDSVRSEEGIEIALAREGRTFTMFLNGIPVTDYTVNAEGADTAKVFPAFVFVDDSKQSARFFDYAFTTQLNKDDWNRGEVVVDGDIQNGSISLDKESYSLTDRVVITATPDSGYVCTDIKINGVSHGSEIVNNVLTVAFDRKIMNVTAEFIDENSRTENKVVNFPNADGLQVRLVKGGDVVANSVKTVADGKVTFSDLALGWYRVEIKAFGIWTNVEKTFMVDGKGAEVSFTIENAEVFVNNSWNVSVGSEERLIAINADSEDGWFATKISNLSGYDAKRDDTARIGVFLLYEGDQSASQRSCALTWKKDSGWVLQELGGKWDQGIPVPEKFNASIGTESGLWFVLHRTKENGKIAAYVGTNFGNLCKIAEFNSDSGTGKNVAQFGVYKAGESAYGVTFSEIMYGATAEAALGVTLNGNALAITGSGEVTNGTVAVSGAKGGKVEIAFAPADNCFLSALTVNGVDCFAEVTGNKLVVSDLYLKDNLTVSATFTQVAPVAPEVTFGADANGLKVKLVKNGADVEGSEKTVTDGKIQFPELQVAEYEVWMNAFGVWVATQKTLALVPDVSKYSITIANASVFAGGDFTTNSSVQEIVAINVDLSDGWFVTQISGVSVTNKETDDAARFGLYFEYGNLGVKNVVVDWKKDAQKWKLQETGGAWDQCDIPDWAANAMENGDGLWFAVHRMADGTFTVYLGTKPENMTKLIEFSSKHNGETNTNNISKFGVYKENPIGGSPAYGVTFSNTGCGTSAYEAFGLTADTITVTNNATVENIGTVHGTVTVAGTNIGDEVTLTVAADDSDTTKHYVLKSLLVNGIERKDDLEFGSLKLADKYMAQSLTIVATFEEAQKYGYQASVDVFKAGQSVKNGILVFTDATGAKYELSFENGVLSGELYTGTYTVTVKDESGYVFENATVTVDTEAITGATLKAAWQTYKNDSYTDALAANTTVQKTINGNEITFDGTLNLGQNVTKEYYKALNGNFDVGAFYQLPQSMDLDDNSSYLTAFTVTLTRADGKYLNLRIHREQNQGWRLDTPHWEANNLLNGSNFEKYIYMSGNGGKQSLNVSYTPDLKNGVYLQIVRVGNEVRLILDEVMINTFENISGEFVSCTLNNTVAEATVCPKIDESITGFGKSAIAGWSTISISENVSGDFTAEFTVKAGNINDFRAGIKLQYAGGCIEFDLTNADGGGIRVDIKGNEEGSFEGGWPTLITVPASDERVNQAKGDGVAFKVVREGGTLKLYVGNGEDYFAAYTKDGVDFSATVDVLAHTQENATMYIVTCE